ncbi:MAG TPA: PKD domain-containing protein [Prolixibacteraceae bacterium]|nr:PKD domain-containing protein [Prolixibacteraceae bacterium]
MKQRIDLCFFKPWFVVLFGLAFLLSCTSFDPAPKPSRNLEIGEEVEIATQSIPSGGGTVLVNAPESEIDGMEIIVPPGSYKASRTFKISTAPITSDKLGANFNPLTPVIQVDNGGGYAETPMEVTIPVTLPEGEFPIGFFYNEISGSLEGLPLLNYFSTSVTVLTRHFMSESEIRSEWDENLKGAPLAMNASANMLVASVNVNDLERKSIIESGFIPGTDDWEFTNLGSYKAPHGHCAGQSMTAMWYYYEKKLNKEPALFHRFDLLNDKLKPSFMWMDNPLGYRFSSVIQNDFNFDGWINSLWMQSYIPELTFKTFAAAMFVTGQPQSVLIRNSQGEGGHAMIVYKVDYNGGKLHIADPNYPNNRDFNTGVESIRTITLENGAFKPYLIGLSAQSNSLSMDEIGFAGKTSYISWGQIGKRYSEVLDSTIGNVAPNTFPAYTIRFLSANSGWMELKDNTVFDNDSIFLWVEDHKTGYSYNIGGKWYFEFDAFNEKGEKIDIDRNLKDDLIILKPGLNKIGIFVHVKYSNNAGGFVDFKWVNIVFSKLKIEPDPILEEPGKRVKLTVRSWGTAPARAKYVWNFGDGTKEQTVNRDSTVQHTFANEGLYDVTVTLYNAQTNEQVGMAKANAYIAKPTDFSKFNAIQFIGDFGVLHPDGYYNAGSFYNFYIRDLNWYRTTFSYEAEQGHPFTSSGSKSEIKIKVSGEVSNDLTKLIRVEFECNRKEYSDWALYNEQDQIVSFANVPVQSTNDKKVTFFMDAGAAMQSMVQSSVSFWRTGEGYLYEQKPISEFWSDVQIIFSEIDF